MAFQPADKCVEVVIHATCEGKSVANVFHARRLAGYTQTELDVLSALVAGEVSTHYPPLVHSGVTFNDITVRGLQDENDITSIETMTAVVGTGGAEPQVNNQSFAVKFTTGRTGRSARGRAYMFPCDVSAMSATNVMSTAYVESAITMWEQIQTAMAGEGWEFIVLSRFHLGVKRTAAEVFVITDISVTNNLTDSMRHRLPRGH